MVMLTWALMALRPWRRVGALRGVHMGHVVSQIAPCFALSGALQSSSVLFLLLLLGRSVEQRLGGPFFLTTYLLGLLLASIATLNLCPCNAFVVATGALLSLFVVTARILEITAVKHAEPLPGCSSITFWTNRWRLLLSLGIFQFFLVNLFSWRSWHQLLLAAASALGPYVVWKRFVDDGRSKLDLKKGGDQILDTVEGWLGAQESQLDAALKVADTAADLTGKEQESKGFLGAMTDGLGAWRQLRQGARQRLDEGLDALASEEDENPPVTGTLSLTTLMLALTLLDVAHTKAGRVLGGFLWPDLPSLSCGIFLLLLLGRAIESRLGPSTLLLAYLFSSSAVLLLCRTAPLGLAPAAGLGALLLLGLSPRWKRPKVKSLGTRGIEVLVLCYFMAVWAVHYFPNTVQLNSLRSPRLPAWSAALAAAALGALGAALTAQLLRSLGSRLQEWRSRAMRRRRAKQ